MYGSRLVTGVVGLLALSLAFARTAHADPPAPRLATGAPPRPVARMPVQATARPTSVPAATHAADATHASATTPTPAPVRPITSLAPPHEALAFAPPPRPAGYAQQGSRATPWGEVGTLPVHGEEKKLWRVANRLNPGYAKDGNDRFVASAVGNDPSARHVNCVLASLSFEDSMTGHPTVALAGWAWKRVTLEAYQAKLTELGPTFAESYVSYPGESTIYATRYPGVVFEKADDFRVLENRLATAGEGSRMVLVGTWTAPNGASGGHAINMVNLRGTVLVVDAQSGQLSKPAEYFGYSTWSGFRYHVTAEGAPGKSPFESPGETPTIRLGPQASISPPAPVR